MQIYRSLLTFFSSLSSSRYFKLPNSTQQQKKTYHKAIKQSQTVYEQSPNDLVRHHVPTATGKGTPSRNQDLGHPRSLIFRCLLAGERRGKVRSEKTDWSLIPCRISLVKTFNFCSANKLTFKTARVREHLGVGVWGTFIPDGKKGGT